MNNKPEIQEVRMGKESIMARPGHVIVLEYNKSSGFLQSAMEFASGGKRTKELWLGPGAFIIWKES
jgi:hypothetical protein